MKIKNFFFDNRVKLISLNKFEDQRGFFCESFSDKKLRRELTNTKQRKWWSFWVKSFDPKVFNEDK